MKTISPSTAAAGSASSSPSATPAARATWLQKLRAEARRAVEIHLQVCQIVAESRSRTL